MIIDFQIIKSFQEIFYSTNNRTFVIINYCIKILFSARLKFLVTPQLCNRYEDIARIDVVNTKFKNFIRISLLVYNVSRKSRSCVNNCFISNNFKYSQKKTYIFFKQQI